MEETVAVGATRSDFFFFDFDSFMMLKFMATKSLQTSLGKYVAWSVARCVSIREKEIVALSTPNMAFD